MGNRHVGDMGGEDLKWGKRTKCKEGGVVE